MVAALHTNVSPVSYRHEVLEDVLRIAHSESAGVGIVCGDKTRVTITKHVTGLNDPSLCLLLSGIELVTHQHFCDGRELANLDEWILKSMDIDVTVLAAKGAG